MSLNLPLDLVEYYTLCSNTASGAENKTLSVGFVLIYIFTTSYAKTPFQVLSLPSLVAPTKVLIVPLSAKEEFDPLVQEICESQASSTCPNYLTHIFSPLSAAKFRQAGVFSRVDDSNTSIGKRYARNDELGTPFGVTIDFACTYIYRILVFRNT
jgi:glycyl-tRNA synthetase (class II)